MKLCRTTAISFDDKDKKTIVVPRRRRSSSLTSTAVVTHRTPTPVVLESKPLDADVKEGNNRYIEHLPELDHDSDIDEIGVGIDLKDGVGHNVDELKQETTAIRKRKPNLGTSVQNTKDIFIRSNSVPSMSSKLGQRPKSESNTSRVTDIPHQKLNSSHDSKLRGLASLDDDLLHPRNSSKYSRLTSLTPNIVKLLEVKGGAVEGIWVVNHPLQTQPRSFLSRFSEISQFGSLDSQSKVSGERHTMQLLDEIRRHDEYCIRRYEAFLMDRRHPTLDDQLKDKIKSMALLQEIGVSTNFSIANSLTKTNNRRKESFTAINYNVLEYYRDRGRQMQK